MNKGSGIWEIVRMVIKRRTDQQQVVINGKTKIYTEACYYHMHIIRRN